MRRLVVVLAAVATVGTFISVATRHTSGSQDGTDVPGTTPAGPAATATSPTTASSPTAGQVVAGVTLPSGFAHDGVGATAAGVALVELSSQLINLGEDEVAAVQAAVSAAATRTQLVDANRAKIHQLRAAYPNGGLTWRLAPLATCTTVHSPDAVQVAVWRVGVLTVPDRQLTQDWAVVVLDLVWENSGWRVLSEQATPGPVPAAPGLVPSPTAEWDARLTGFTTTMGVRS